jgi:predicted transporter
MTSRTVEVFIAGCPVCDEAVELVRELICESCDLQVVDMRTATGQAKATRYGVQRLPTVVVDGMIAACCHQGSVDVGTLRNLGVGSAT